MTEGDGGDEEVGTNDVAAGGDEEVGTNDDAAGGDEEVGTNDGAAGEEEELSKLVRIPVSVAFKQYESHSFASLKVLTLLVSTIPPTSPRFLIPDASAPSSFPTLKQ